jgi:transcriptional regulator with XRE-family HTH domain
MQRRLAKLSLRDLAARTAVSNPYLSQIERGLHEPSLRVLKAIAEAPELSTDELLAQAGLLLPEEPRNADSQVALGTKAAIRIDATLSETEKTALPAVYHSYQEANRQVGSAEPPLEASRRPAQTPRKWRRTSGNQWSPLRPRTVVAAGGF